MIKRFCDICGKELGENYISIKLPRFIRQKVRGGKRDNVIGVVDVVGLITSDICYMCQNKLAVSLPVVDYD